MNKKVLLADDLRFLIFSELYLKYSEPKTRRRAFAILEAAIKCFAKKGFEYASLAMIARQAGVTRQLLDHYFDGLQEIRELSLKYIRLVGQSIVVREISNEERPEVLLKKYIEAHTVWLSSYRVHIQVWLGFLFSSACNAKDRTLNSVAVRAGTNRIQEIIVLGKTAGVFECDDPRLAAKLIQILLLGWLMSMVSEEKEDVLMLSGGVVRQCLKIAGAKSPDSK